MDFSPGIFFTITLSQLHDARRSLLLNVARFLQLISQSRLQLIAQFRVTVLAVSESPAGSRIPLEALSFCGLRNQFILISKRNTPGVRLHSSKSRQTSRILSGMRSGHCAKREPVRPLTWVNAGHRDDECGLVSGPKSASSAAKLFFRRHCQIGRLTSITCAGASAD